MSNSVAEAYLLIVRESNVPIFGEAVPVPFTGQIELDSWAWEIKNKEADDRKENEDDDDKKKKPEPDKKGAAKGSGTDAKEKLEPIKPDSLIRDVKAIQGKAGMSQEARDKKVLEVIKKAVAGYNDDAASDADDKTKSKAGEMVLKFEKGTDLATTPLLYALARGDIVPKAILTLFHRSKNAPVTLAITMGNLRFTNYTVTCDPDDKMADIKETWEATYQTIDWMYQNRPAASGPNFLTQGTVRVFVMKQEVLPF
ncbi:MAG: type VI secretion system tube protein Hcp [Burkholderiales bacterium]|nr:type VI secretion system tube protein Hcp [Burkholderiales bacterium]